MIKECLDCNWYDDVLEEDTFLLEFGEYYICQICAEGRGLDYDDLG